MLTTLARLAFVFGLLAVIVLSIIQTDVNRMLGLPDIVCHMVAYAALAFAGGIAFRRIRNLYILSASLFLLGATLELAQGLVSGRDASGYELLANTVGIAIGGAAVIPTNILLYRWPQIFG